MKMAFRNFRQNRGRSGGGFGIKRKLANARRTASKHRKKAATLTTVAMVLGGFLAYDKLLKK